MTHEEAIDIFICLAYHNLRPSEEEIEEAFKVLKEREESKQVEYISDGDADGYPVYDMAQCPCCDNLFEDGDENWNYANYCPNCGQRLRWKE